MHLLINKLYTGYKTQVEDRKIYEIEINFQRIKGEQ